MRKSENEDLVENFGSKLSQLFFLAACLTKLRRVLTVLPRPGGSLPHPATLRALLVVQLATAHAQQVWRRVSLLHWCLSDPSSESRRLSSSP
ncbi:hypothetical protein NL676_024996 [Syzygium grande]|nr:hypothetical protein NL676_024996 [Syzygium grande]